MKAAMPLGILVASGLLGFGLEKFVSRRLRKIAQKTSAHWDDVLVKALRGILFLWVLLAGAAAALKATPLSPETARVLNAVISIGAILVTIQFVVKVAVGFITLYVSRTPGLPVSLFRNITTLTIYILGLLIILERLDVSITPIITALGVGGLAVALALQDTLANLFSGLHLLATKKVRAGDYVKLETGEEGYVQDITWRNTTIRALANHIIIVPNSKLAAGIVMNYDLPDKEVAVLAQVGVSYQSDLKRCEEAMIDVARDVLRRVPGGVPEFDPFVRFHTFGDSAVQATVILRGQSFVDRYLIQHEFVKALHERFRREGIEIPFPIRTVYLHREEAEAWPGTKKT